MTPPQRQRAGLQALLVAVAALLMLCAAPTARAQQISYTIQVVALSDRDSAEDIMGDLLRQGFPAYIVRSTSSEGAVYRVRVGAFANRPAALLYAEAMPQIAGGQPVPALAEAIPPGITPLAPRLVLSQDLTGLDARLMLVGDSLALRTQQRTPLGQAEYALMVDGAVERVRAWQLSVAADGTRVVVRDMQLWPDTWQEESGEVLEGYQSSLIALVAERLGLDPATVRAARYGTTAGAPRIIVVERMVPGAADGPELLGLGLPVSGMTPAGPLQYLGIQPAELPGLADGVRVDLATETVQGSLDVVEVNSVGEPEAGEPEAGESEAGEPEGSEPEDGEPEDGEPEDGEPEAGEPEGPESEDADPEDADSGDADPEGTDSEDQGLIEDEGLIEGPGWYAVADGPFVRLTVPPAVEGAVATSWRAALGTPLWSGAGYLLAHVGKNLLIYDFLPRN